MRIGQSQPSFQGNFLRKILKKPSNNAVKKGFQNTTKKPSKYEQQHRDANKAIDDIFEGRFKSSEEPLLS